MRFVLASELALRSADVNFTARLQGLCETGTKATFTCCMHITILHLYMTKLDVYITLTAVC